MPSLPSPRRASTDPSVGRRQSTYGASLNTLCKTPEQPELYSRLQYQNLASYLLNAPAQRRDSTRVRPNRRQNIGAFVHVVVHTFPASGPSRRDDFNLKDGLARFVNHLQPESAANQVVFIRGSLSPAWVDALGDKYKIDPEFFRRHLRYLAGRDYSDLPSLPSSDTDILTLTLSSLYTRSHPLAPEQIKACRDKDADIARKNQNAIAGEPTSGETIIRRFSTLGDQLFSVEHEISIFTRSRKTNGSQIAIVLLDNGLDMNEEDGPPCFSAASTGRSMTGISLVPVIVPRPATMNINIVHPEAPSHNNPVAPDSIGHVASLLPFYLGMSNHALPISSDIFVVIAEVFRLVAGAECQFLNRMHSLIQDQEVDSTEAEEMDLAINTLRYTKRLLEDHKQRMKLNLGLLERHRTNEPSVSGLLTVPGSSTPTSKCQSADELLQILVDFTELLNRTENLTALCTETIGLILNGAMLHESQKAIQRADDQKRLTVLAYLFLPLSLIASLFGMNVKELDPDSSQSIWLPFVVLAPVAVISYVLFSPNQIRRVLRFCGSSFGVRRSSHHTQGATIPLSNSRVNGAGLA